MLATQGANLALLSPDGADTFQCMQGTCKRGFVSNAF